MYGSSDIALTEASASKPGSTGLSCRPCSQRNCFHASQPASTNPIAERSLSGAVAGPAGLTLNSTSGLRDRNVSSECPSPSVTSRLCRKASALAFLPSRPRSIMIMRSRWDVSCVPISPDTTMPAHVVISVSSDTLAVMPPLMDGCPKYASRRSWRRRVRLSSRAPPRNSSNQTGNPMHELTRQSTPYGVVVVRAISVLNPKAPSRAAIIDVLPEPDSPETNSGGAGARLPRSRVAQSQPSMTDITDGVFNCSRAASARISTLPSAMRILLPSLALPVTGLTYRILSAPMQNPGPTYDRPIRPALETVDSRGRYDDSAATQLNRPWHSLSPPNHAPWLRFAHERMRALAPRSFGRIRVVPGLPSTQTSHAGPSSVMSSRTGLSPKSATGTLLPFAPARTSTPPCKSMIPLECDGVAARARISLTGMPQLSRSSPSGSRASRESGRMSTHAFAAVIPALSESRTRNTLRPCSLTSQSAAIDWLAPLGRARISTGSLRSAHAAHSASDSPSHSTTVGRPLSSHVPYRCGQRLPSADRLRVLDRYLMPVSTPFGSRCGTATTPRSAGTQPHTSMA